MRRRGDLLPGILAALLAVQGLALASCGREETVPQPEASAAVDWEELDEQAYFQAAGEKTGLTEEQLRTLGNRGYSRAEIARLSGPELEEALRQIELEGQENDRRNQAFQHAQDYLRATGLARAESANLEDGGWGEMGDEVAADALGGAGSLMEAAVIASGKEALLDERDYRFEFGEMSSGVSVVCDRDTLEAFGVIPRPGGVRPDGFYLMLVGRKAELAQTVSQLVEEYRRGEPPSPEQHYPAWPEDFPPAAGLPVIEGPDGFVLRQEADTGALGSIYAAVRAGEGAEMRISVIQYQQEDGAPRLGTGDVFFARSGDSDWDSWILADQAL